MVAQGFIAAPLGEEYVFRARISKTGHTLLCIYTLKEPGEKMKNLHRREVIMHVIVPVK